MLLFTGNTIENALTNTNIAINTINANFQQVTGNQDLWINYPRRLNANPNINGLVYYYGVSKPPIEFMDNVIFDLNMDFNQDWIIEDEEG